LLCKHQVIGSIPIGSTIALPLHRDLSLKQRIFSRDEDTNLPVSAGNARISAHL
jgi:hypothetical protein